jgi:hypothetical protein
MLAVRVRITPETGSTDKPSTSIVEDVIWAAAETQDRLEHLTVDGESGLVSIIAFVRADNKDQAVLQVRNLIGRALVRALPVRGWSLSECAAVDL